MHDMPYKLPTHYANKRIKLRVPYSMPGLLDIPAQGAGIEFPDSTFLHSVELPFEVWDMQMHGAQLDGNNIPIAAPAPGIDWFWSIRVQALSKNQAITKNTQLVQSLKDRDTEGWYWRQPWLLERAEGFIVSTDNALANNVLRASITFRGFLVVLDVPSETR